VHEIPLCGISANPLIKNITIFLVGKLRALIGRFEVFWIKEWTGGTYTLWAEVVISFKVK
jgi:hypothetical protein